MNYRERRALFTRLTEAMERSDWPSAIALADALRGEEQLERRMFDAVLSAYIDGNDRERAAAAGREYAVRFPADGMSHFYLGRVAFLTDDWAAAERHFRAALSDDGLTGWYRGAAESIYGTLCREEGRPAEASAHYLASCREKDLAHGKATEYSNYLFNLHYRAQETPFLRRAAEGYGRLIAEDGREVYTHERTPFADVRKLRIGYLSHDLRFHVVAFFLYALLHDYDRGRFEVYAYTDCREDGASRGFQAMVDVWRDVRGSSYAEIARLVHEDRIDILFEPGGHTAYNFLRALAHRPAPVQISGIGYFDTTGLSAVNYFLGDRYADPAENDASFVEQLVRLPKSHFCYMWHDAPGLPAPAPFLRKGYVTFGCFNNFAKVTDEMLRVWAAILAAVPDSRLYLKAAVFNHEEGKRLALARLAAAGIDRGRLVLGRQEPIYLQAYRDVDIALDTYPYPGGGTTCDALYMGVPVISCYGQQHGTRFGYSLLMNLGHAELCAPTLAAYAAAAVSLARDDARLARLHRTLRAEMLASPLMQGMDYAGCMEQVYTRLFLDWQEADLSAAERAVLAEKERAALTQALAAEDWPRVRLLAGALTARERDEGRGLVATVGAPAAEAPSLVVPGRAAWAWEALALACIAGGEWARASFALRQAIAREETPKVEHLRLLAQAEIALGHYVRGYEAAAATRRALESQKGTASFRRSVLTLYAKAALSTGRHRQAVAAYQFAAQLAQREGMHAEACALYSSYLLAAHCLPLSEETYGRMHCGYQVLLSFVTPLPAPPVYGHDRIRVGYLSGDFRHHVMFSFLYALLAAHDARAFEVYCYSLSDVEDDFTALVRQAADVFRTVHGRSYEEIARTIRADEIDVLVDLGGHSAGAGLPVLAWRPACVQVSGLGYPHATGLAAVDAFLTDQQADGAAQQADWLRYHEAPVFLRSQFCYTGRSDLAPSAGAPCKERGYVTFGVFQRYQKITDEMLCLWQSILDAVPGSRLLLKCDAFGEPEGVLAAIARLERLGLDISRVDCEAASPDYMERLRDGVDIALDTYPYPGGGTTCDALYMGVPVVTRYGRRRDTRFGLSILAAAGLAELAFETPEAYVAGAVALARDAAGLELLHRQLRALLLRSPLMDAEGYTREVEQVYCHLVARRETSSVQTVSAAMTRENPGLEQAAEHVVAESDFKEVTGRRACPQVVEAGEDTTVQLASIHEKLAPVLQLKERGALFEALDRLHAFVQSGALRADEIWRARYLESSLRYQLCDLKGALAASWAAIQSPLGQPLRIQQMEYSDHLFMLHYLPHVSDEVWKARQLGYDAFTRACRQFSHAPERHVHARLRIGYLAYVFRENVESYFTMPLLLGYDRSSFEVYCYQLQEERDLLTEEIEKHVTSFRTFAQNVPFSEVARDIYEDEIDILFDFDVHASGGRTMAVMCYRPAPVQVAGIGYMSTSGSSAVDYFLGDGYCDPPGLHDEDFCEEILRMRHSHFCYTPSERVRRIRRQYAPHTPVVFGSFNNFYKLTDEMLTLWLRIVRAVPGSHLLLKNSSHKAAALRVTRRRLLCLGFRAEEFTLEDADGTYLARYLDVDIALDPYPYTGGATTLEALYMGVPVVSRYGRRHGERFGYSILRNLGLEALCTDDTEAYVRIAVDLAHQPERLAWLHAELPARMQASPLMDGVAYVREMECHYKEIWRRYLARQAGNQAASSYNKN